jgi:hypothetical protein
VGIFILSGVVPCFFICSTSGLLDVSIPWDALRYRVSNRIFLGVIMDPIFGAGVVYLILALLVGLYARGKGRSGLGFFLLSVVFSPLIGFIIALIVAPIKKN